MGRRVNLVIAAVLIPCTMLCAGLWVAGDLPAFDKDTNAALRAASTTLVFLGVAVILWAASRRDRAPDFLRRRFGGYFERDGFCFVLRPNIEERVFVFNVYYQNRYARECCAHILLCRAEGPPTSAPWSVDVACEGGAFGVVRIPWGIPAAFQGGSHKLNVYAEVVYQAGHGQMLRYKEGAGVGAPPADSWSPVGILAKAILVLLAACGVHVWSSPASIAIVVPTGIAECLPDNISSSGKILWRPGDAEQFEVELPPVRRV
jgi:hypothetical protein